ncbi:MAG TPA: winged helix DNA-binding protein [Chitinophaga sp.]|uniref:MarR family winged helix-turn-helix transcriptional regulator n=1 Tax=Chitinophaga sp. TaxID=1869181 RepID=UPI002DBFDA50|nr:winged helix DNA-binding protein [Chitinophaga sp.]HEU4553044.1 winged helix DNA-binding protein [Chitinophaga sp.]
MNTTVQLVAAWGAYEEKHPGCSIEDFCRYYLLHQQQQKPADTGKLTGGLQPATPEATLMKVMGRIMRLHGLYSRLSLEDAGIGQFEEFALMNNILQRKNPRKSEVIYATIYELSTGTDLLNRLREKGYITEVPDPADRRSKRVKMTAKGEKTLQHAYKRMGQLVKMMLRDMDTEEVQLCIQLLKHVEIKFSERWPEDKGRSFDEIYTSVMSE